MSDHLEIPTETRRNQPGEPTQTSQEAGIIGHFLQDLRRAEGEVRRPKVALSGPGGRHGPTEATADHRRGTVAPVDCFPADDGPSRRDEIWGTARGVRSCTPNATTLGNPKRYNSCEAQAPLRSAVDEWLKPILRQGPVSDVQDVLSVFQERVDGTRLHLKNFTLHAEAAVQP